MQCSCLSLSGANSSVVFKITTVAMPLVLQPTPYRQTAWLVTTKITNVPSTIFLHTNVFIISLSSGTMQAYRSPPAATAPSSAWGPRRWTRTAAAATTTRMTTLGATSLISIVSIVYLSRGW